MRIVGHGIDLLEIARIAEILGRHEERFLERVFTPGEQAYRADSRRRVEHLAARFAAKEAVMKALGTGLSSGITWSDIEVESGPTGAPTLRLHGRAAEVAAGRGITVWHLSLSHTDSHALASVIACGG
ncbi:MAG: holo-ACP synthase [Leptolyngbya sp. PLA1]|nr:holo-ACP synthase [Leptolyngbya sp. PLA1]